MMYKKCIWCFKFENETTFNRKAHTIPSSLGGQNYNQHVCDECNSYFGNKNTENRYSIEEALKETFCISRERFLNRDKIKRKVGRFKSMFFEVKEKKGKIKLQIKRTFKFTPNFQKELCRNFKRGLIKMWFEEYDRQLKHIVGTNENFNLIRNFARYNIGDIPVIYFKRSVDIYLVYKTEAETPFLQFNRMKYLYENDKFIEIEFLGHVFGFPKCEFSDDDFNNYLSNSIKEKKNLFSNYIIIERLIDIDF